MEQSTVSDIDFRSFYLSFSNICIPRLKLAYHKRGIQSLFGVFCALAEFERDLIVERTYAGLQAARAGGRIGGRLKI